MPRKPIQRSKSDYYHITARSNNREFFYLPMMNVWDIMCKNLAQLQQDHQIKIAAFVLMNNHFHLLALTPVEDIDRIMYLFMKKVTRDIQKKTGRINKIFGGRYKGSLIQNDGYLMNVYKYIYRNPIEAGLSDKAEAYPYSSLFFRCRHGSSLPYDLEEVLPSNAFGAFEELEELAWINQSFEKNEAASIRCGLKKTVFKYKLDRATSKPIGPVIRHAKKNLTQA